MKKIIFILLFFISQHSFAQCFSSFTATSGKSIITLNWTLNSSCQCPQVIVEWSTDSMFSNPVQIYTGTLNTFDHATPDLSRINYYRVNTCGYYSQTIAIRVGGQNFLFFPNPVSASNSFVATIYFQNQYNTYFNMYIFDHNGQLISKSNSFAGTTYQFSADALLPGLYIFIIASATNNVAASGKFFVANN